MVSDLLHHLDTHKCMGPDKIHRRMLRDLVEMLVNQFPHLSSVLVKEGDPSWLEVNVTPIYKKSQKEDLGN